MDLNPIDEIKNLINKAKLEVKLDLLKILMDLHTDGSQLIDKQITSLINDTKKQLNG